MTPVMCCGFECGQLGSIGQHWTSNAAASISITNPRTGSRCLRINTSASNGNVVTGSGIINSNTFVYRVYIRFSILPDADTDICQGVRFNLADSSLYAGTVLGIGSTGIPVSIENWYLVNVKIVASANPWTYDVNINGVNLGQATRAAAPNTFTSISLGTSDTSTTDIFYDDFIASQTAADYPIMNGGVRTFIAISDGSHNIAGTGDFQRTLTGTDILNATTTAFQLIDDVPLESGASVDWINMVAPPNATDYVECIFGPAPGTPTPTYGPRAVEVIAGIHQAGTGTGNMEIRINDNGTTNAMYTATGVAGVTNIAYKRKHYATAINGGGAWGIASGAGNFNNLRVRFGSPAAVDANPDQYLDCIMIEAEFAEWPQKIVNIKQAVNRASTY